MAYEHEIVAEVPSGVECIEKTPIGAEHENVRGVFGLTRQPIYYFIFEVWTR